MKKAGELISKRIAELGDWRGEALARMRKLIREADPEVVEEWKWNGPVWSRDGILCTGESYRSVVKLTFAKGASLKDPGKLFNSSLGGNTRRAIDIHEGEKVDGRAFKSLIRAAVAANLGSSRAGRDRTSWACPRCDRTFRQVNQRHACGVGSAATLLAGRPKELADVYRTLETTVRRFGEVEVVTRDRYALFRTTRIFADLTVMREALRVVVHLGRKVGEPHFIKIGTSGKRVSHVALVRTAEDLRAVVPYLREAFDLAVGDGAASGRGRG